MAFFLFGLGLVLALEGALYALFPQLARKMAALALSTPPYHLRLGGIVCLALGILFLWMTKGQISVITE
jgi:uncharacterized protein YjeT (DUF2065 family)